MILKLTNQTNLATNSWASFLLKDVLGMDMVKEAFKEHDELRISVNTLIEAVDRGRWQLNEMISRYPDRNDDLQAQHRMGVFAIECEILVMLAAFRAISENDFTATAEYAAEHEDRFMASKWSPADSCNSCKYFRVNSKSIEAGRVVTWSCARDDTKEISFAFKACDGQLYEKW